MAVTEDPKPSVKAVRDGKNVVITITQIQTVKDYRASRQYLRNRIAAMQKEIDEITAVLKDGGNDEEL